MRHSLTLLLIFVSLCVLGSKPDTLQVITHNKILMVTNPAKGENPYTAWGVFPGKKTDIRTLNMTVTLGCPDSIPCAHWDYLDHIYLRRQGGKNGTSLNYELSRMLTPYGSIFDKGWQWSWTVDVTDFSMVLRDSVEVEYNHSGYEPSTVGWKLTVSFTIITGTPIIKPISISRMWEGSYRYGDPKEDIESKLSPIQFQTESHSAFARLRIQHTGHGMDSPKGCSEFCPRYRDIKFDGATIDRRNIWKKCGTNPLYPQGGTWIYDRGNWCPGYLQEADVYDVNLTKGAHSFDIDMEPYVADSNIQANESIASYVIQYEAPENRTDAAIVRVISPTNDKNLSRLNPVCSEPHIMIRNNGRDPLRSVVIYYGTQGYPTRKQTWHGNLKFNQSVDVWLRGPVNFKKGKNTFVVRLLQPNGTTDGWEYDNQIKVDFEAPLQLPDQMILQFRSNEHPRDNKISIMDAFGGIVYMKEAIEIKPNTTYFDTLKLLPGCYELNLSDTAGDGLEFWFEPDQGHGFLRLLDLQGRLLYNFESDCGSGQHLAFTASGAFVYDTAAPRYAFSVYPLRVKDQLSFDCLTPRPEDITVLIRGAENAILERHIYSGIQNRITYIEVSHLTAGRYFFEVQINGNRVFKKRFNKE